MKTTTDKYAEFIAAKTRHREGFGFEPLFMPSFLFPFQQRLVDWAVRRGRAAVFADCGLGKTPMQLVWAQNIVEKTCKPVLILTPLAVGAQTVREADKFGIEAKQSRDGQITAPITITNYQQLHKFDWQKFGGVVCDESSILKSFEGKTRQEITGFMRKIQYGLLCTATAAPNDYMELGTSSEALGELKYREMLAQYFTHDGGETSKWRLKGHAGEHVFWRWICTWARALRMPSDMGCSNEGYELPELKTIEHIVSASKRRGDYLFDMPAITLQDQREERRRTINERCELAARLVADTKKPAIAWCHLNDEGHLLEKLIPGAVEVEGSDADEYKEESFEAFSKGQIRVLISKPVIAGFGLNWQHCSHQTFFPSHSFEQWYQAIRRSWRFGQKNPVRVDMISSEGEAGVLKNLNRKAEAAAAMFEKLVSLINHELEISKPTTTTTQPEIPSWL